MSKDSKAGFSLIELLIAISLASMVLLGVASIAAQMVRQQVDGIRSGTVTGWSVVSYGAMIKEIEDANVLAFPIVNGAAADQVIVCTNWSRVSAARLNTLMPSVITQYCVDPTPAVAPQTGFLLRRHSYSLVAGGCPSPGVPTSCTSATPGAPWTTSDVIGFRLEKLPGFGSVFTRDDAIGGVRIRYGIGQQTATANQPVIRFTPFDVAVGMTKQYSNTLD